MRILSLLWRIGLVFALLILAFVLSGAQGTRAQIAIVIWFLVGLCVWVLWPVFTAPRDERLEIHRHQQKALTRYHKMRARDRNEPRYTAWWKSLGIGR